MRLTSLLWVVVHRREAAGRWLVNMPYEGPQHAALGAQELLKAGAESAIPVCANIAVEFEEPAKPTPLENICQN